MRSISLTLPYPPSVNTYWGFHGHRRFLTKKANEFKAQVQESVFVTNLQGFGFERLCVIVRLYPPDRRIRDIDNCLKPLLDALVAAQVFIDDGQIDRLIVSRETIEKHGKCEVMIQNIDKHKTS